MLSVENLSKTYANGVCALDGVSLDIEPGMFGLLGPNGAGKSSLMRTLATLQEADSGSATLNGTDMLVEKDTIRRQLGYLPQEFGAYPRTSPDVMLNHLAVLKGFTNKSQRLEMVDQLLQKTNLVEFRKRSIDTFSGGMKQRFGIAQALIGDPKLMIVDEPTAGLDPAERRRFHNLLARIGEDVVVILSTHIVDDVSDLCRNMAIMGEGKILANDSPAALTAKLRGKLWSKTVPLDDVAVLKKELNIVSTRMVAGETEIRVVAEQQPEDMEAVEPNLEDVYFATLLKNNIDTSLD